MAERDGWEAAGAIIEQYWDRLATAAPQHLLAAIRALPGAAFVDRPTFLVAANYLQHVVIGGNPGRFNGGGWLDATMAGGNSGLLDTLGLLTGKSAGSRTEGRMAEARRAAEKARAVLQQASELERTAVRASLPHLRLQWGRSLELADAPGAEHEYEEAYELAMITDQRAIGRRAAAQYAWLSAERGHLNDADLWLARALDQPAANGRYDGVVFLASALLRLDRGDLAGAEGELARTSGLGDGEHWAAVLWVQSMIAHDAGSAIITEAQLTRQLDHRPDPLATSGANGRYIRAARARLNAIRNRSSLTPTPSPCLTSTDKIISAAIDHGAGRHHDALNTVRSVAGTGQPPRSRSAALLITAGANLRLGHPETAADAYTQAHALIEHERLYTSYECIPPTDLEELSTLTGRTLPRVDSPFHPRNHHHSLLSKREHEVLVLLAQGNNTQAAADALFVSVNTLRSTVKRLYRKLGVESRSAAIDTARQSGLL